MGIALLLDAPLQCHAQRLQTMPYACDRESVTNAYGTTTRRHLDGHYQIVEV